MQNSKKKILAISGSTRSNSSNQALLKTISELYKGQFDFQIYDGITKLPHFNPDVAIEQFSSEVKEFIDLITKADGVIICTPEYIFSIPGSLKNALEWTVSSSAFSGKPTAIIVASGLGEKAFESLQLIMRTIEAKMGKHASLLIQGVRAKFGPDGKISDRETLKDIDLLVHSLLDSIENLEIA